MPQIFSKSYYRIKGLNQFRISPLFTLLEHFKDKFCYYGDAILGNFSLLQAASFLYDKLVLHF